MESSLNSKGVRIAGWAAIGLVLISSLFIFFYGLGEEPFYDYDEATYADVIEDTQASGDISTLQRNGQLWFEKPPLYFWFAMMSSSVIDDAEYAYRFPSALLGVISVLLVVLIIYTICQVPLIAAAGGAILLTSAPFIEAARQVRLDVGVSVGILLAVFFFIKGLERRPWLLGIAPAIALGFLIKSAVVLFAGPAILIWALVHNKWNWLKSTYLWIGNILGFILLALWHVDQTLKFGIQFWNEYLLFHVIQRFSENIINTSITTGDFIEFLFTKNLPWSILLIFVLGGIFYLYGKKIANYRVSAAFTAIAGFIILIFSFSASKIVYYLVPTYPFIALAIGTALTPLLQTQKINHDFITKRIVILFFLFLLIGGFQTLNFGFRESSDFENNRLITKEEYEAAQILNTRPEPYDIQAFEYVYWETINYYSDRPISRLNQDDLILDPFFLLAPTSLLNQTSFSPEIEQYMEPIYKGIFLTILKFEPIK